MILSTKARVIVLHIFFGAMLSVILLHPITKAVYWFEFNDSLQLSAYDDIWSFLFDRFKDSFRQEMITMSLVFALIGGCIGAVFAIYHLSLVRSHQRVQRLEKELAEDLPTLIKSNENERLEFKSSMRWDFKQQRVNKELQAVIAKSIAGFINHQGGNLLIGIDDDGQVVGLENDYQTLRHKNRDGFELCLMDTIKTWLGGDVCSLVHCVFHEIEGKDVCRIFIESSATPVYCNSGNVSRYYLRTGNGTRELDARESFAHISKVRTS
jgi:phosphotransferase system  glucose/maltose/N-acetylglucosamine-specific IIC component